MFHFWQTQSNKRFFSASWKVTEFFFKEIVIHHRRQVIKWKTTTKFIFLCLIKFYSFIIQGNAFFSNFVRKKSVNRCDSVEKIMEFNAEKVKKKKIAGWSPLKAQNNSFFFFLNEKERKNKFWKREYLKVVSPRCCLNSLAAILLSDNIK